MLHSILSLLPKAHHTASPLPFAHPSFSLENKSQMEREDRKTVLLPLGHLPTMLILLTAIQCVS